MAPPMFLAGAKSDYGSRVSSCRARQPFFQLDNCGPISTLFFSIGVRLFFQLGRFVEALRSVEAVLGRRKGTADDYVLRAKIRWAVGMVRQYMSSC